MEAICKAIQSGNEKSVITALVCFNETNKTNFQLGESPASRKVFCSTALTLISREQNQGTQWSLRTISLTLNALRIFAREFEGVDRLVSKEGLKIIATLAELSTDVKGGVFDASEPAEERVEVIVEAVKVLCNIVLNNRHLAPLTAEIGCLVGLSYRLNLSHTKQLPHNVLFFDLRLLFLITACGPVERETFRDACNGLPVLINVVDSVLFGPSQQALSPPKTDLTPVGDVPTEDAASKLGCENGTKQTVKNGTTAALVQLGDSHPNKKTANTHFSLAPLRDSVYCLCRPVTDKQCSLLCEALKIIFNQTLNWKDEDEYDEDELCIWSHICHLLKIILISVSPLQSKLASDTISHCTEVLVNSLEQCACKLLLPPEIQIMPTLSKLYSDLYQDSLVTAANTGQHSLFTNNLDCVYEGWNMAAMLALINHLYLLLTTGSDRPSGISSALIALRILSKGHRCIRRFMRLLILPPLKEVKARPDEGDTLKSRVIRLMTIGSLGAEEVTADLLFVLCKENVARFVKHTGFGNAAGLLLSRGLLGGGKSKGEVLYSSDSETSDTEEYDQNRDKIDPVTGGLSKGAEPSPLDHMTEEEKEIEAEKLAVLFDKLNTYGVIKALPVNKDGELMHESASSDED